MQEEEKISALKFNMTGNLSISWLQENEKYRFDLKEDGLFLHFHEPMEFDFGRIREIENSLKANIFSYQIFNDIPANIELSSFRVIRHGLAQWAHMSTTAYLIQENKPKTIIGASGNLIFDFEAERKNRSRISSKLESMMNSGEPFAYFAQCLSKGRLNPAIEFEYYYQIIDYLKNEYESDKEICRVLDFERDTFSKLIGVLNNQDYIQSRHRGKTRGGLIWAPKDVVWFARNSAKEIVIKYLKFKNAV